jgi:hypothetical protein
MQQSKLLETNILNEHVLIKLLSTSVAPEDKRDKLFSDLTTMNFENCGL